ncbi:hypothetical protein GEMRC1_012230 [Eukaryota sp. GEM-RC1]
MILICLPLMLLLFLWFSFSAESVVNVIKIYPKGSAGGVLGWTNAHLGHVLSDSLKGVVCFLFNNLISNQLSSSLSFALGAFRLFNEKNS